MPGFHNPNGNVDSGCLAVHGTSKPSDTREQTHGPDNGELPLSKSQKRTDAIKDAIERLVCAESAIICAAQNAAADANQRTRLNVIRGRLRAEIAVMKAEWHGLLGDFLTEETE